MELKLMVDAKNLQYGLIYRMSKPLILRGFFGVKFSGVTFAILAVYVLPMIWHIIEASNLKIQ